MSSKWLMVNGQGQFNKLCQKRENHYIYPIKASLNEQDKILIIAGQIIRMSWFTKPRQQGWEKKKV